MKIKKQILAVYNYAIVILVAGILMGCQGKLPELWKWGGKTPEPAPGISIQRPGAQAYVKIAILVPLSGKYAPIGRQLLDAAQLALFHFNNPNMELIPLDTGETIQTAQTAAQEAVRQSASLILGPLFSDATKAVMPIAQQAGIQVISFSNDKKLAGTGAFILGFRPESHIQRVVEYANRQKQLKTLALMVPDNSYGTTITQTVSDMVAQYPGTLQLVSSHIALNKQEQAEKWAQQVQSNIQLLSTQPKQLGLLVVEGDLPLPKIMDALTRTDFQASQIQLIGTAAWYDDQWLTLPSMEGALFAALPRQQQLYFEQQLFMQAYHYQPRNIASLAYDGVALAATLAEQAHGKHFTSAMFTNTRGFLGVNGLFRFTAEGLVERGLAVIQIQQGKFVIVDPTPRTFAGK